MATFPALQNFWCGLPDGDAAGVDERRVGADRMPPGGPAIAVTGLKVDPVG